MAESLLTGQPIARARQLLEGKALTAASMAPVIQGLLEQVDAECKARQAAEQRADTERAERIAAENSLQAAVTAKAEAEACAIRDRAACEAAQATAAEASARATRFESMHRQECDAHEQSQAEIISLRGQLATAKAGEQVAKEEAARLRREKPAQPQAQKPVAYRVGGIERDANGRMTSMNITPGS